MIRFLPFALALAACGPGSPGSQELSFDVRRVDAGAGSASLLAVLDQDGDGLLDLLVAGEGRVIVLRGDGSGRFETQEAVDAGEGPVDVAAGDLDEDGRLDLVVANHETRYVTLLFRGADGFASGRGERLVVDVSPHPHAVAVADLDEDGHLDFVVDDRGGERLVVLRGAGDGSFAPAPPIPVGGDPYRGMVVQDVDGDGHLDAVTPNPRTVAVQLGDGSGSFEPGPRLEAGGVGPFSVAVGDFDGDGILDVAAGSGEGRGSVGLWWGTGAGAFQRAADAPYAVAEGPTTVAAGDVDGDGVDDLLVTSYVGGELAILLGGEGGFRIARRVELGDRPWGVAAGDLNRDGRMDVVTAHDGGAGISVLMGRGG